MSALSDRIKSSVIGDWFEGTFSHQSPMMRRLAKAGYNGDRRVRLYRKLSVLVKNGKRLQAAVDDIQARAAKKSSTDVEAIALADISEQMRRGQPFGVAIREYVPLGEAMVIQSGEKGGTLPQTLNLAAELILASKKMRGAAMEAVAYPLLIMSIAISVLAGFSIKLIPAFSSSMDPNSWTGSARGLYLLSEFVTSPWALMALAVVVGAILTIILSLKRWAVGFRSTLDRVPPWSFYRLVVGGGWLMSLAALLNSGTTLIDAMQSMRQAARDPKTGNPWLLERLSRTVYHINQGLNLGRALEATKTHFPDQEIVEDLVFYSDMPEFDRVLLQIGQDWVSDGVAKVQIQARILKTLAIMFASVLVGFLFVGFFEMQAQLSSAVDIGKYGGM